GYPATAGLDEAIRRHFPSEELPNQLVRNAVVGHARSKGIGSRAAAAGRFQPPAPPDAIHSLRREGTNRQERPHRTAGSRPSRAMVATRSTDTSRITATSSVLRSLSSIEWFYSVYAQPSRGAR